MPLALGRAADTRRRDAVAVQPDRRRLATRPGRLSQTVADACAPQTAAAARGEAAGAVSREVRAPCRLVHRPFEGAAIIDPAEAGIVGHVALRDQVASAQRDAVGSEGPGRLVQDPLENIGRFGGTGAAIGRGGVGMGMDAGRFEVENRNAVDAGQQGQGIQGRARPLECRVGAEIDRQRRAQAENAALPVECQTGVADHVPPVIVADQALAARRDPLDRPRQPARRPGDEDELRIVRAAHAEAAPDIAGHDPKTARRQPEDVVRQDVPQRVGAVNPGVKREAVAGAGNGERAARLDRVRGHALVDQPLVDQIRGRRLHPGELLRVPGFGDEGLVVEAVVPDRRGGTGSGVGRARDRRHRLILHPHELGRVPGDGFGLGDDHGNGLADMAHPFGRQGGTGRHAHRRTVASGRPFAACQPAEAVGRVVLPGEDGAHARQPAGRCRIDDREPGMGVGRAQERGVRGVGRGEVVEEPSAAREQPPILAAPYRDARSQRARRPSARHHPAANSRRTASARFRLSGGPLIWITGSVTPVSR